MESKESKNKQTFKVNIKTQDAKKNKKASKGKGDDLDNLDSSKTIPRDTLNRDISKAKNRVAKTKLRVLDELRKSYSIVTTALAKADVSTAIFYIWLKEDKDFKQAVENIDDSFNTIVEDKIKQKIVQNDGHMLRFYASHRIKKFRPKLGLENEDEAEPFRVTIINSKGK